MQHLTSKNELVESEKSVVHINLPVLNLFLTWLFERVFITSQPTWPGQPFPPQHTHRKGGHHYPSCWGPLPLRCLVRSCTPARGETQKSMQLQAYGQDSNHHYLTTPTFESSSCWSSLGNVRPNRPWPRFWKYKGKVQDVLSGQPLVAWHTLKFSHRLVVVSKFSMFACICNSAVTNPKIYLMTECCQPLPNS